MKILPNSLQAEKQILGCILLSHEQCYEWEYIDEEQFYTDWTKKTYKAILCAYKALQTIDPILVDAFMERETSHDFPSLIDLLELTNEVLNIKNFNAYCELIREKHILRQLISIATDLRRKSLKENKSIIKLIDNAEKSVLGISALKEEDKDLLLSLFYDKQDKNDANNS